MKQLLTLYLIASLFQSCQVNYSRINLINSQNFETQIDGKQINLYTLKNNLGTVTQITNYGGRVVSLWVADNNENYEDIVLGFENIEGYLSLNESYFGALIGRFGNRIANGKFMLNDSTYTLANNNGSNHLHGGKKGYNNVVWTAYQSSNQQLELRYMSKDGEEGYPGNLDIKVLYTLTNNNELKIEYEAETDKATPINLTHHSYFNLQGSGKGSINDHLMQINASYYTPINSGLIPTGEIATVKNTPFDFLQPRAIGERVNDDIEQIKLGFGYDHNFVLDGSNLKLAARVEDPISGRIMVVYTTEPGLQFYGGNFLDGKDIGKYNLPYKYRTAFCLETQHFPDSPNRSNFPSTILMPGEIYTSTTIYKFFNRN